MVINDILLNMTDLNVKPPQYQFVSFILEYQLELAVAVTPGPEKGMP